MFPRLFWKAGLIKITPKIRQYIQASNQSVPQLADELGVSEDTIRR